MKLQLLALLFSILFKTAIAQCPDEFSLPQFQSTYISSIDVNWGDFLGYGLEQIEGESYFYYIDTSGLMLQLQDLNSTEVLEFSLEPLRAYLLEYTNISFLDINTVCIISKNEKDVILFDLIEEKIIDVLSFTKILRPLEYLYIHPQQKIQKMGDYLIIPTIFGEVYYSDLKSRIMIQRSAPFVLYDLKQKKPFTTTKGKFWPAKYIEEADFDDFLPNISHDDESTIYFNYKYSDTLYSYNVEGAELKKEALNLDLNFPKHGLIKGNPGSFRKFETENPFISKYFFHPGLKKHIVFIKPQTQFIVKDRITSIFAIPWHLYILDEDLKLYKKYCISRTEAGWYLPSFNLYQIILPNSNIDERKQRTFRGLNIEKS